MITALVVEWAFLHRTELMDNWHQAMDKKALTSIAPLE